MLPISMHRVGATEGRNTTHSAEKEGSVGPHDERDVGKGPLHPLWIVVLILRNTEEITGSTGARQLMR